MDSLEKPAEKEYLNCIRCGLCLAVCPTYRENLNETASPRGRVALARKGLEGELELSPNLIEQMYACFACMACNEICPVGINPADLALEMRDVQEQSQPAGWKKTLFGGLIPHPGRMEAATLPLRLYEQLGIRRLVYALGLTQPAARPAARHGSHAAAPAPASAATGPAGDHRSPQARARYRVGFFLGCAQSLLFAEESAATVRVLARNGCTVITPKEAVCCGMPARGYGRVDLVRAAGPAQHRPLRKGRSGNHRHRLRHLRLHAEGVWRAASG